MLEPLAHISEAVQSSPISKTGKNCWYNVTTEMQACADSQEDLAALLANEYNVTIEGIDVPANLTVPNSALARNVAKPQATYILGIVYDNGQYDSANGSYTLTTDVADPCSAYGNYTYGNVSDLGSLAGIGSNWSDRISSFQGYGHCGFELLADSNYGGSTFGPTS